MTEFKWIGTHYECEGSLDQMFTSWFVRHHLTRLFIKIYKDERVRIASADVLSTNSLKAVCYSHACMDKDSAPIKQPG